MLDFFIPTVTGEWLNQDRFFLPDERQENLTPLWGHFRGVFCARQGIFKSEWIPVMNNLEEQIQRLLDENLELHRQNKERDQQIAALLAEVQDNTAKIEQDRNRQKRDRQQRKFADSAIWLILGLGAAFVIGYRRDVSGSWSYDIAPEIALAIIGLGGTAVTFSRKEEPD